MIKNPGAVHQKLFYTFLSLTACLVLMFSCGKIPVRPENTDVPEFTCGFEDGTLKGCGWEDYALARNESAVIVTNPAAVGSYAVKIEVAEGDTPTSGTRAEFGLKDYYFEGSKVIYSWSLMIDPAYRESDKWQVLAQWHDRPDEMRNEYWEGFPPMSPPLALSYQNGNLRVIYIQTGGWSGECIGEIAAAKGQWIEISFEILWSTKDDGYQKVSVNSNAITGSAQNKYRHYGRNMRNPAGNYFRIGLYRDSEITSTDTIYVDDIRIKAAP